MDDAQVGPGVVGGVGDTVDTESSSPEQQALANPAQIGRWRLPEADRDALIRWGLPNSSGGLFDADYQDAVLTGTEFPGEHL